MMDQAAIERLRIAVKVLNSSYDHNEKITEAEIKTLKSYLGGDLTNVPVEDIAAAVIRRELNLNAKNQISGRTRSD
jgi:hypothetical protein